MRNKNVNNISWGLFGYKKPYFYFREKDNCMFRAKDEFFKLFSEYFYLFWD